MNEKQEPRPIGQIFQDPQFGLLVVVESEDCEGCVYNSEDNMICNTRSEFAGSCTGPARKDGKYVKYIPHKND